MRPSAGGIISYLSRVGPCKVGVLRDPLHKSLNLQLNIEKSITLDSFTRKSPTTLRYFRSYFFTTGNSPLPAARGLLSHWWSRRPEPTISRRDVVGRPDLDQRHGLEEADNSPLEQGTLFLPPSLAIAFPTPPNTRTLLAAVVLRVDKKIHASRCNLRVR